MLVDAELRWDTYQLADGRRVCRVTDLPTGIFVEREIDLRIAVVEQHRQLQAELQRQIMRSLAGG